MLESEGNFYIFNQENSAGHSHSKKNLQGRNNSRRQVSQDSTVQMRPDEYNNSALYINSTSNVSKSSQRRRVNELADLNPSGFSESNLVQTFRPSKDTVRYDHSSTNPSNLFRPFGTNAHNENVYVTASWPKSPDKSENMEMMHIDNLEEGSVDNKRFLNTEGFARKLRQIEGNLEEDPESEGMVAQTPEMSQYDEQSSMMFHNNAYGHNPEKRRSHAEKYNSMDKNLIFPNHSQKLKLTNSFNTQKQFEGRMYDIRQHSKK